ncbi:GTP-binding protein HSR1-releated protein [Methanocaldococcus vulcanius M7]|uniref:Probable GTP-binding protein EngB n=1 Tax=Methanocaldococcus vulcanius (strain ATCC 700851 / DSM 12094 / M7) TaxID=579137 RepID=C9RI76_METVM|nr:GTP-binding protein EngB [Methanocaldococcus vulcanius]ACX73278.1 GTP-binding protein HSR1-releated protein [Methanocaldococcus vulcanius M7]
MDFFERYTNLKRKYHGKKEKPKVVVVGRSNVGKSTFVRLMTGRKDVKVGKRPGLTLKINEYDLGDYILVDLPGFGYMSGLPKNVQEKIKDEIVHYIENNADKIATAVQIIDAKSFFEIVRRWDERGEIPIDLEMFDFITDLKISPILVVNKMDKIKKEDWDTVLDGICEFFKCSPPWRQWKFIVPAVLKKGQGIDEIKKRIKERVDLFKKLKVKKH